MAISYQEEGKVFSLHTQKTTYQFQVGLHDVLLHLYYGKRIEGEMEHLICQSDVGFSGVLYESENRVYSLDTLPQEFPSEGVGDYRTSVIEVRNGDGSQAVDFRYVSHQITMGAYDVKGMPSLYEANAGEAETLEVMLRDQVTGVEVLLFYTVFEKENVIARSARVRNGSDSRITLEKILSACLELPFGDWEMLHFHGRHAMERMAQRSTLPFGTTSLESKRGTSSHQHNPGVILCDPHTTEDAGDCYGLLLTYSSNFIISMEKNQLARTRTVLGIHPEHFRFFLDPEEEFDTPQVIMSFSSDGLAELSHQYHTILQNNLCRGIYQKKRRPILINNWEATYFDFNKDKLVQIARQAAKLGIEMLVMDDGWFGKRENDYSGLGDWFVNEAKLQGTLSELIEEVNALDMKFGIWMEPEMISEDSDLYRAHPDWALTIPGRKPCLGRSQLVLDLSRKEVVDYLFERISNVLDSGNIEYLKWDMNRSMCDIYSQSLEAERQGEVYHRCVLGLYDLLERVVSKYPQVLLEGCSGGGGRFDPAMLYYSPQIWCSDNTDAIERLDIQYGTSFFYPIRSVGSHVSASPNHQIGRSTSMHTRGVVAMAGSFGYELDLNLISDEDKEMVTKQVAEYKRYYEVIQGGSYYRLTNAEQMQTMVAWQMVAEDKSSTLISVVMTHVRANLPAIYIKLKGLDAKKKYRIEDEEKVYSGSALMYGGLAIPYLHGNYPAKQIYLVEVKA